MAAETSRWWVKRSSDGKTYGPYPLQSLQLYAEAGRVAPNDTIWSSAQVRRQVRDVVQVKQLPTRTGTANRKALGAVLAMFGLPIAFVGFVLCCTIVGAIVGLPMALTGGWMFGYGLTTLVRA